MAVYTRYAKVLDAEGKPVSVREALALINQMLDEVLAEQEGDFDADSRWALAWFEQSGFDEGAYGVAETLSKAKNTSIAGIVEGGILASSGGKVRLLRPEELAQEWDPHHRCTAHRVGDSPPSDPRAGDRRRNGRGTARGPARRLGRCRPRIGLSALYRLRAEETRGGSAVLQWSCPKLAGDHPAGGLPKTGPIALTRGTGVTAWLSRTKIAHVAVCIQHLFAISRRIAKRRERLTSRLSDPRQCGLRLRSRKLQRKDCDLANRGQTAEW